MLKVIAILDYSQPFHLFQPDSVHLFFWGRKKLFNQLPHVWRSQKEVWVPWLQLKLMLSNNCWLTTSCHYWMIKTIQLFFAHRKCLQVTIKYWTHKLDWIIFSHHCIGKHYCNFKHIACTCAATKIYEPIHLIFPILWPKNYVHSIQITMNHTTLHWWNLRLHMNFKTFEDFLSHFPFLCILNWRKILPQW